METFGHLLYGFQVALQPLTLFTCFIGVLIGTLVGVLPGLGPVAAISLLLPATFHAPPVASVIMLAGIYYGAMYGGSTTSILVNLPGEAASVVTCLDGYQMARKGRAGVALGICAFGSFIAGTVGVIGLSFLAPPLAAMALRFGPPEYFAVMVLGLTVLIFLAGGSMIKSLMMACVGLIIGNIGLDTITAQPRAPKGLPADVRKMLMNAIIKASNDQRTKDNAFKLGLYPTWIEGPEYEKLIKNGYQMMGPAVQKLKK